MTTNLCWYIKSTVWYVKIAYDKDKSRTHGDEEERLSNARPGREEGDVVTRSKLVQESPMTHEPLVGREITFPASVQLLGSRRGCIILICLIEWVLQETQG